MKRTFLFVMMCLLLLLAGCTRTAPYEANHGVRTYTIDPGEGTVTRNGHTCSYEVRINRGVQTSLVLRYPTGEWIEFVSSIPGPDGVAHSKGYPQFGYSNWPAISDVWNILQLDDAERQFPRVEPPVWVAFLLVGLFCVLWPDKVPFTGNPEDEGVPTKAALRSCRIIGTVCVVVALVLAGLYILRIALEFYNYGAYLV